MLRRLVHHTPAIRPQLKMAASPSAAKRLKSDSSDSSSSPVTIGTHNGHFHADEALAVYLLRRHIPAYAGARLVRTRDPALLASCHTVVDVGGEYDPAARRFDHHQRSFTTTFPGRPTKLSSAGLVYMHFGREIVARHLGVEGEAEDSNKAADAEVSLLYGKIYESFVEALDAHDNGIAAYDPAALAAAGIQKRFSEGGFSLGAVVSRLNPAWNEPAPDDPAAAQAAEDARFETASRRIGEEFDRDLEYYTRAWMPARGIVAEAFAARRGAELDPLGRILVLRGQAVPWKDHLYALEDEDEAKGTGAGGAKVLYVLYPESPIPDAKWRVQAVPVSKDSFESRKPLPEAWRGARDETLDGICDVPQCVFVHASGFIGGNKTFEGALAMAKKALEM